MKFKRIVAAAMTLLCGAFSVSMADDMESHMPGPQLKAQIERYAQVDVTYDESILSEPEKEALARLVQVGGIMDEIFLRQVWRGNPDMRKKLVYQMGANAENKDVAKDLYHFFKINFGPWNRLEHNVPFIGNLEKPAGAGYYPEDMTKKEFEKHIAEHPGDKKAFEDYFTIIERNEDGSLKATPYAVAYKTFLARAAKLMNEAADILTNAENKKKMRAGVDYATLANFLRSRAAAFSSNSYVQSDMDWMDIESNVIDVTIGPYEVYEDGLFAYKAAFEAFITILNPSDSEALHGLKAFLPDMERNLPIDDKYKNMNRGTDSPISVVDVVFIGGDSKAGVQTIAFNLPNDETVREAKGSKKVMLKNISRAKYDKILIPIAEKLLDKSQMKHVNFDSYFTNVLMHELAHGLGPGTITLADGTETTVNKALQTLYSPLEECKADIMGLYNKAFLVEKGYITQEELEKSYVCFLPGFFRAIRFGVHEAHGRANMIQYNYLMDKGAITLGKDGRYTVHFDKMPDAIKSLTHDLCMVQANGDYDAAKAFLDKWGTVPEIVETQLESLETIPTDIEPVYAAARFLED